MVLCTIYGTDDGAGGRCFYFDSGSLQIHIAVHISKLSSPLAWRPRKTTVLPLLMSLHLSLLWRT